MKGRTGGYGVFYLETDLRADDKGRDFHSYQTEGMGIMRKGWIGGVNGIPTLHRYIWTVLQQSKGV